MSFPRYERYEDSGVEWLEEVPEHWCIKRNRTLFEIKKRIAGKLGFDVLSITQRGIRVKDVDSNEGQLSLDYSKYQIVEPGQFAMNHMDLLTGFVDLSPFCGVTSPDYRVFALRPNAPCDKRYLLYLLQNAYQRSIFYAFGQGSSHLGRWRLPTQEFNDFRMPVPPEREQRSIAGFLDHETTKIDALIQEQQRLIELLKEKRQAVISHAVTKGLDPTVPMKDSGVEWIGSIPANWAVTRLRQLAMLVRGGSPRPAGDARFFNGSFSPWITVGEVTKDEEMFLDQTEAMLTQEGADQSRTIPAGAVILTNSGATLGVPKILRVTGCANDGILAFLNLDSGMNRAFLYFYLASITESLRERMKQGSGQPNLNTSIVGALEMPLPPSSEQDRIAQHLERQLSRYKEVAYATGNLITLLQERRAALISAAVTGKIDVRNYTPRETPVSDELYQPA